MNEALMSAALGRCYGYTDLIPDELGPNICAGSDGEACVACAMPEGFDFGEHACKRGRVDD